MRPTICISGFMVLSLAVNAQNADLRWVKQMGGNSYEQTQAMTLDAAGNIYTTGYFSTTVDFDPGPGTASLTAVEDEDVFVCKMDSVGNLIWVKQFGGTRYQVGLSIVVDAANNVYVGGIFFGLVDFDPGPGSYPLRSAGNEDDFICKLNPAGDLIWVKQFGGPTNDRLNSIALDANGGLLVTGYFEGSGDFDPGFGVVTLVSAGNADIYVLKLAASDGSFTWVKQIGGTNYDASYGIATDALNNIYVTGFFLGSVDFDPGPSADVLSSFGLDDVFTLKLDSSGIYRWAKQMGGNSYDRATDISIDKDGNVILTGYFDGTADFDPGAGVYNLSSLGSDDIFVAKLDSNGSFNWARAMGGTLVQRPYMVTSDNVGDIYTIGYFEGLSDFDPGPAAYNLSSVDHLDIFISKLNKNGDFVFAKQFGGLLFETGFALSVDNRKNIFATGFFQGTVDFDPNIAVQNLTSNGGADIFLLKLQQCPTITTVALSINTCKSYVLNNQVFNSTGIYTQILYNSIGCDSVHTTLDLTITRIFTDTSAIICEGETYLAGGVNQTLTGIYYDTLQNSLGCDSVIVTHLTVKPKPALNLGPDRNLCESESLFLDPGTFVNYLWHDLSTGPSFTIFGIGQYWLRVTGTNQCTAIDTLNIFAIDTLPKNFLPATGLLCPGNVINITVSGYKDYLWSNNQTTATASIQTIGEYYLAVTDFNNCKGKDTITIQRTDCIPIGIPNAFTPNNDGLNDIFKPTIFQSVQDYHFYIYNRSGQQVFETRTYGKGWDGKYHGKDQPAGTYVYRIVYTNVLGYESENNGTMLLLR